MKRKDIGDMLRTLRGIRRMSRKELEERAWCRGVGAYERGERIPTEETVRQLAKALCVPTDYLTRGVHSTVAREQPCWTCAHICDYTCPWAWELRPIPGWQTEEKPAREGEERLVRILYCPGYDQGQWD